MAAPRSGLFSLGRSGWLATSPDAVKQVLTDTTTFDFPGDVSRSGDLSESRGETRSGHLAFTPLPPQDVARGVDTFTREWAEALARHDRVAPGEPYDGMELLRAPVSRATCAAVLSQASPHQHRIVADLVLTWIDALAPIIAARRAPGRWSRARRREARARIALHETLEPLLQPGETAPMMATFLAAGIQVPIAAGAWMLAWMAAHPAPDADPGHVVWETLRLTPPTWVTARIATREVEIQGRQLPAGSLVWVSPLLLGRNTALIPDGANPSDFAPDRWHAPEPRPGAWLPFGAGPHACPGRNLGMALLRELAAWAGHHEMTLTEQVHIDQTRGIAPLPCLFVARPTRT